MGISSNLLLFVGKKAVYMHWFGQKAARILWDGGTLSVVLILRCEMGFWWPIVHERFCKTVLFRLLHGEIWEVTIEAFWGLCNTFRLPRITVCCKSGSRSLNLLMSFCRFGSNAVVAYSKIGLTRTFWALALLGQWWMFPMQKTIDLCALANMVNIDWSQSSLLFGWTPRYGVWFTCLNDWPNTDYVVMRGWIPLFVIIHL